MASPASARGEVRMTASPTTGAGIVPCRRDWRIVLDLTRMHRHVARHAKKIQSVWRQFSPVALPLTQNFNHRLVGTGLRRIRTMREMRTGPAAWPSPFSPARAKSLKAAVGTLRRMCSLPSSVKRARLHGSVRRAVLGEKSESDGDK